MTEKILTIITCDGCGENIIQYTSPTYPSDYRLELRSVERLGPNFLKEEADPLPKNLHFCNLTCLSTWDLRGQMTYDEFLERGFVDSRRAMERHDHQRA